MALILCIPSYVASYLSKDYESFFDSSTFKNRHILNIPKENNSEKTVALWFFFSAHCPMKLYFCSKFHENIDFKVIDWIRF